VRLVAASQSTFKSQRGVGLVEAVHGKTQTGACRSTTNAEFPQDSHDLYSQRTVSNRTSRTTSEHEGFATCQVRSSTFDKN
jgi:hypothetical protein